MNLRNRITYLIVCFLLAAWPHHHAVIADQPQRDTTLVVQSYLAMPARNAMLKSSMGESAAELRFWRVDADATTSLGDEIKKAKWVLLDIPHDSVAAAMVTRTADTLIQSGVPYVVVGSRDQVRQNDSVAWQPLESHAGVSDELANHLRRSFRFGGQANAEKFVEAAIGDVNTEGPFAEVSPLPKQGFYHPNWPQIFSDWKDVDGEMTTTDGVVAAIAINPATITSGDTDWVDAVIEALQNESIQAYAFYGPRQNPNLLTEMTRRPTDAGETPDADILINAALVFRPQERKQELDRLGIPILQTIPSLKRDEATWRSSDDGVPMDGLSYYFSSSELAGMIDPILITARNANTGRLDPIAEQVEALAKRIAAIGHLQQSDRSDRRVAMMVYNYPQGENHFGASFLNVPRSLVNVIEAMREAGYEADKIDEQTLITKVQSALRAMHDPAVMQEQCADGTADFVSLANYEKWFDALPSPTKDRITKYWGTPSRRAGEFSIGGAIRRGFGIAGLTIGNVRITPQPPRFEVTSNHDADERKKQINHKSTVPLSHEYLATYLFLRQSFRADAIVHFGTHGSVEWAPGKERALAASDDPSLALGSVPNLYPYIMDNLGEATTAKRRGRAIVISHLTPMVSPAGFRPGLHEMHDLMHDWETVADGPIRQEMQRQLVDQFVDQKLDRDLGWSADRIADDFDEFMEVLHPYLDDIAQTSQPQGLAVLGEVPSPQRRFAMVMQMLRKRLIESLGEDIDEVFLLDSEKVLNSRPARWLRLALQDPEAASRLDLRAIDRLDSTTHSSVPNRAAEKKLDPTELLALAHEAQRLNESLSSNQEIESLLSALDGKHVPSSYGGDPVRNPDSLPTGRNLYGFDPTRVPTQTSWKIGVGVLDDWIATYRDQHDGQFAQQIAMTMWAGETMRHQGVMEAQLFHAIGVRPVWDETGRMTGYEIVPSETLGRPRIDVLMSVTGSYRDQFPHVMRWIDQAIIEVAELPKSKYANHVADHSRALKTKLQSSGLATALAERQSTARVFSNESGAYGTGINDAVLASDVWDDQSRGGGDAAMAELFTHRMGFAYGEGLDGVSAGHLFRQHASNLDAAFLSRSSSTYGVLTSDDAFAYLGGFALAARAAGKKEPELVVQNLRDESEVILDSAATAIAKEMQTRYLHPQWIKAQQAEGYSGTLQALKASQFLWGWQVTAPGSVREDQWQSLVDTYVNDQYDLGTRDWMRQHNPAAMGQMIERMIDAVRLGYWQPSDETAQTLYDVHREIKSQTEMIESNAMVSQFVSQQEAPPDEPDWVSGQELKPRSEIETEESPLLSRRAIAGGVLVLFFTIGAIRQARRRKASA